MAASAKEDAAPNASGVALTLVGHGAFLSACGYYGAATNGFAPKAMHSLYAGCGGGALLILCAAMSVSGSRKAYMIGVHVALPLQVLFAAVFAMQAKKAYKVPGKEDRFPLFVTMFVGSIVALGLMRALKPKKAKKS